MADISARSRSATLLFNLWNGYAEDGRERYFTPEELFSSANLPLLLWRDIKVSIEYEGFTHA